MTNEQQAALIALCCELETNWDSLPIEVCEAWEHFENVTPDGKFRDELRDRQP